MFKRKRNLFVSYVCGENEGFAVLAGVAPPKNANDILGIIKNIEIEDESNRDGFDIIIINWKVM